MPQRHLVQLLSKLLWPADRSLIANNTDVIMSDAWVNNFASYWEHKLSFKKDKQIQNIDGGILYIHG